MHGTILYAVGISSLKGLKENQRERLSNEEGCVVIALSLS